MTENEQNISSAEITAYLRSQEPALSQDDVSYLLASDVGIHKAHQLLEDMSYPLMQRKIVARTGYFYQQALRLLKTGRYASCISIASGFSMLTYLLAQNVSSDIQFVDTDLPPMLAERQRRIEQHKTHFDSAVLQRLNHQALDITSLNTQSLTSLFPNCQRPLFIVEGVLYFLEPKVVNQLFEQITAYSHSAVLLDYWPENALEISAIFKRIVGQLKGFIAEEIQGLLTSPQAKLLNENYTSIVDISILEAEALLSQAYGQSPELLDQNDVFPIRILVAE